jgi:Holliday junction resolvasome RuvABC DNA-binding subunit
VLAGERLERPMSAAHVGASAPRAQTADRLRDVTLQTDRLRDETRQMRADAVLALHTLGFKKPEATAAVDAALAAHAPADLEALLRLALRRCPR